LPKQAAKALALRKGRRDTSHFILKRYCGQGFRGYFVSLIDQKSGTKAKSYNRDKENGTKQSLDVGGHGQLEITLLSEAEPNENLKSLLPLYRLYPPKQPCRK
jgi:hypothetical protein